MELERERTPGAANGKQPETVVVGVGLGGSEGSALRAFQAEVEESTLTRWLEASTVDGALARLRQ